MRFDFIINNNYNVSMFSQNYKPAVSIVIPIYRDATKIGRTIETLVNFLSKENIEAEIIIVNDGGQDGGVKIVQAKMKMYPLIKLIDRQINRGKGFSVREGLRAATGDFIFYTDADLPYLTQPIKKMLDCLKKGEADFVLANRDLSADQQEQPGWPRQITHIIYSFFVRLLIPIPFSDTLAGLKGMHKKTVQAIVPKLTIDRFSFDVELLLLAQKAGCGIKEIPVSLKNVGKSNLSIRRDAPTMIREVVKIFLQNKRGLYEN